MSLYRKLAYRTLRESLDHLSEASNMKIVIEFDPRDDLSDENKDKIEGSVLTSTEANTAKWARNILTYRTNRSLTDIINDWESEGFNLDEFKSFTYKR
jgi:hypothetical protein